MDLRKVLQIGKKIEVRYREDDTGTKEKKGYSLVQDVRSHDEIVISLPMLEGVPIILEHGNEIEIEFYRDDGCFRFTAEVIEEFEAANVNMIKIKKVSSMERLQRRDYYRLRVVLPIHIRILSEDPNQDLGPWLKAYALNLSGGGIKISSNEELDRGAIVQCKFKIKEERFILKGKVIRITKIESEPAARYEIGLSFIDITENDRDEITKFIFEEQIKLKKKGFI